MHPADDDRDPHPTALVALATYRRPTDLARILPEVSAQAAACAHPATVLVVDNDPDGGARAAVEEWADRGVRYVHEPRPGISAARNRALDEAGDATLLLFVDDDEVPLAGWLDAHLEHWLQWRCAAIAGPTTVRFEGEADAWVRACGLFDRAQRETGSRIPGAASNNLLLDLAQLRQHGLRFDEQFGLSGGSDTRLIHQLVKQGGEVRWCDEADVIDVIPAQRSTRTWVLNRTRRTSNTWSRVALDLAGSPAARLRERGDLTARAVVRWSRGASMVARGRARHDLRSLARGEVALAEARGMLAGAWGRVTSEYARPPA